MKLLKKDMTWLLNGYFAHRGVFNKEFPENSMEAFDNAIKYGYGIELDVQFSKDEKLVVFHDDNLKRVTGDNRNVCDVEYRELKTLKLSNTEKTIPLFEDVLKKIDGKVPLIVEIKHGNQSEKLAEETFLLLKKYKGKYAIQSFDPFILNWYVKNQPQIIRGQLSASPKNYVGFKGYEKFILANLLLDFKSKPDYISYELKGLPNFMVSFSKKIFKTPILVWTIKNENELSKAKICADGYIFDSFVPRK